MKVKLSLLASMGVIALVGAGCSSTTDTTPNVSVETSSGDVVVSEVDLNVKDVEVVAQAEAKFKTGENVLVDLGYGWYEGKVEEFACETGFYVRYKGLSASCITEDKLVKPVTPSAESLVVGAKVIANIGKGEMFGGKTIYPYYSAEVMAVNGEKYTVKDNSKKEYELTIDKIYLK